MASPEVLASLEILHREIEKLEPAIKHVQTAQLVTQTVKTIPQKHVELLQEVKDHDIRHKEELKRLFAGELSGFMEENNRLQRATSDIQEQVKLEQSVLMKLKDTIQIFHERVEKIAFPERLDKLDSTIAGIMVAVQSVQNRQDALERNLGDRLRDMFDYQKETRTFFQSALEQSRTGLEQANKRMTNVQRILAIITWALTLTAGGVILYFLKK
jgi:hypothetical protein